MQIEIREKDLAAAEARVQELKAADSIARINPDYAKLNAPISGWVLLMASNGVAVRVEGLTRTFDQFIAVGHIDLGVREGEIFGFLGPNGAGKSTTIKMLCGILAPTAGRALVSGCDVTQEPQRIRTVIAATCPRDSRFMRI